MSKSILPLRAVDNPNSVYPGGSPFAVTHNPEHGLSYVYLAGPIAPGGAHRTVRVTRDIYLDFDADGRLLGVELLRGDLLHPATKAVAVPPRGKRSEEPTP